MHSPVYHLNQFMMSNRNILVVISGHSDSSMLSLFEFDIKSMEHHYWFLHSIKLSHSANSSAVNQIDDCYFLSVPQNGLVVVHKYEDNHFVRMKSIRSPGVTRVISFDIIFRTFIAIDGYNAGIFELIDDGDIKKRHIVNSNVDGFHYWLPIPVNTLRDEVVLLAQRSLDHGTHKTIVVEFVTYNGVEFQEHEDITCKHFGEEVEWLTCLTDDNGITGSAFAVIEDVIGLIVPRRKNSTTLLFNIQYDIKQNENPRKRDLANIENLRQNLQKQIESIEHDLNIKAAIIESKNIMSTNILGLANEGNIMEQQEEIAQIGIVIDNLEKMVNDIIEFENRTNFEKVVINAHFNIEGEANFEELEIEKINASPATAVLMDIVRKDNISQSLENKTFVDINVKNITFDTINGITKDHLIYEGSEPVLINGNLTFQNNITVGNIKILENTLNDIDINEDLVHVDKVFEGELKFEKINITDTLNTEEINDVKLEGIVGSSNFNDSDVRETFHIPDNLTVSFINGINFTEFLHNICLVDAKCLIPGTVKIRGNITVDEEAIVDFLNDLHFPEDFIFSDDDLSHVTITGRKRFKNVTAEEIRLDGTINGLEPLKLVTLSTDQLEISGNITFRDLELTEELNVTGEIKGAHLDKFLPNLPINETDVVESNVDFRQLEVEGNIIIEEIFNNNNFSDYISDVIYNDEESASVIGKKDFLMGLSVEGELNIKSQCLNAVNIESFITKDTSQTLNMNILNGNVKIHSLHVKQLYDGRNISQVDESLVKLTGEQFISSTLIFTDDMEVQSLEFSKLNDFSPDEYVYSTEGFTISQNISFENISAEWLTLNGNLYSNISNPDLDTVENRYLSLTKNQTISQPWILNSVSVEDLDIENIGHQPYKGIFDENSYQNLVRSILEKETLQIENLHVGGSADIKDIDGESFEDFLLEDPSRKSNGNRREHVRIMGDVYFDEIEINLLSNVSWNKIIESLVFKNETNVELECTKTFLNQIKVAKLIETEQINNISLENILTLEGVQRIKGPVTFHGDVEVDNLNVQQDINEVQVSEITDNLKSVNGTYILKGDKLYKRLIHIRDLTVEGGLNGKSVEDILSGVVSQEADINFNEDIVFLGNVSIGGNLAIDGLLENIPYKDVIPKIVLRTQDAVIEGPITFAETVIVLKNLNIDENLDTSLLFRINTTNWLDNAIFVDNGIVKGNFSFEDVAIEGNLITQFINDTDINTFIPLRTSQTIDHLKFDKVISIKDIMVGNLVNGHKLPTEFGRTVMRDLDQEIHSNIIFQNHVLFREELKTQRINGELASNIVTTHTDQHLEGNYKFTGKTTVDADMNVTGFVNGIDVNNWEQSTVALFSSQPQKIENRWDISGDVNIDSNVAGRVVIGDMNLTSLAMEVRSRMLKKLELEENVLKDYKGICTDLKYMHNIAQRQIYRFKYLENMQWISYPHNVRYTFSFTNNNNHYLLVNDENCLSHLLQFDGEVFYPVMEKIETGRISQIVPVRENRRLFIISRGDASDSKCPVQGTNMWEVVDNNLQLKSKLEQLHLLHESQIPETFYGVGEEGAIEFRANSMGCRRVRKWTVADDDAAFVPRGLHTGLALRTGKNMVLLERFQNDTSVDDDESDSIDTESIITGKARIFPNPYLPGKHGGEVTVITVGIKGHKRDLVAVIEDSSRIDSLIKIYSNPTTGDLMQRIPAVRPSSLVSLEFNQGETLLAFLENSNYLQIYEYKGILGFRHRSSTKMHGSQLFVLTLPIQPYINPRKCLGVIYENRIQIYESIMDGNQLTEDVTCDL